MRSTQNSVVLFAPACLFASACGDGPLGIEPDGSVSQESLTGTWDLTGEFLCCNIGFGMISRRVRGSLVLSEGFAGNLTGSANVPSLADGALLGRVDHAGASVTFSADNCSFEARLVTNRSMTGTVGGCGDGTGSWQATRH